MSQITKAPPINWLGADNKYDQEQVLHQLQAVYKVHCTENSLLGTPDLNHCIVAEALRIKLLPTECLKAEFDDALPKNLRNFINAKEEEYSDAFNRLKEFSAKQRQNLVTMLLYEQGYENGYRKRLYCSTKVSGFAIDPLSLEFSITEGFANHQLAIHILVNRLRLGLKDAFNGRIISGLIFSDIFQWLQIPLVQFDMIDDYYPKEFIKVISFIIKKRMFIPVNHDGKVVIAKPVK